MGFLASLLMAKNARMEDGDDHFAATNANKIVPLSTIFIERYLVGSSRRVSIVKHAE